jgi:large subunit ribosomal protein L29
MKANKIRNMDLGEVERQAQESQEQLFRLRFQMGMGQTEGLKKYHALKKDRARLLTIMNEKRAAGETAAPVTAKKTVSGKKKK